MSRGEVAVSIIIRPIIMMMMIIIFIPVVTCNLDIVYSGCVAERVVTACSLDIVIAAYLYTLPVTADVEWLQTICSDHVHESYSVYLYNVILNKRIMCHVQQYFIGDEDGGNDA